MRRGGRSRRLAGLLLGAFVALLVATGALVAPNRDGVPEASASSSTKTIVRSATLSTSGQNMWGGPAGAPLDQTITLFNETWNASDTFGGVENACVDFGVEEVCAKFGADVTASVSGEIGMSIGLEGVEGGTLSVTYPVTVTFRAPADNSFNPGDTIEIQTSMVVDSANAKIVAKFPGLDRISWDGVFRFDAEASGRMCFFDCIQGDIFDIGFGESGEILGFDPSAVNGCFNILVNFPAGLSTYPNTRCNDQGYIFNPDVQVASTLNPDGTISASGQDQYVVIPVSAVTWAGRLAGLPPYIVLNLGNVEVGGIEIGWTTFNAIVTALETMKQDFQFTPRVDVNLNWGKQLPFQVVNDPDDAILVSGGTADNATLTVGQTLKLTTNATNNKVIPIKPTLMMGSAKMANNTRSTTAGNLNLKALAFTLNTPDAEVCLGELGCLDIWPGTTINAGPIYDQHFSIGSADHTIFNSTFDLAGFNAPKLDAFDIVPRPIVEIRKQVVPFNAPGTFDLQIDGIVHADDVQDGGTTGRVVVDPGTRVISEVAGTGGDLNFFDITIVCVEYDGGGIHTQSAGSKPGDGASMDLKLTGGEDLICTIKNRLPVADQCDSMTFDNVILGTPNSNKADHLVGTKGRDIIVGYGGNDTIEGAGGDDCIAGNGGNDQISLGPGNDVGDGGDGDDNISGASGDDILIGGNGDDNLTGAEGDDVIYGGDGDDTLNGASGNDVLDGGNGKDRANGAAGRDQCIAESKSNCEL